jgi:hypothetical protein
VVQQTTNKRGRGSTRLKPDGAKSSDGLRKVDGLDVVSVVFKPSNLPSRTPTKVTILTLSDGSERFGCGDCADVAYRTFGEARSHRWQAHPNPPKAPKAAVEAETAVSLFETPVSPAEAAVPPMEAPVSRGGRPRGTAVLPPGVGAMTLNEVFQLARDATGTARMLEDALGDREHWKERALGAEGQLKRLKTALKRVGFSAADESLED